MRPSALVGYPRIPAKVQALLTAASPRRARATRPRRELRASSWIAYEWSTPHKCIKELCVLRRRSGILGAGRAPSHGDGELPILKFNDLRRGGEPSVELR